MSDLIKRVKTTDGVDHQIDYTALANLPDLSKKVDVVEGKGLSTNDFTDEYKNKVDAFEGGAKVTVDASLSDSSENPVQNKVIKAELDTKAKASDVYNKTEANNAFATKEEISAFANSSDVYTKTEVDSLIGDINTILATLVEV